MASILQSLWSYAHLPAVVVWETLTTTYAPYNKHRSLRRIVYDSIDRYNTNASSIPALESKQGVGSTFDVYKEWMGKNGMPLVVDELGGEPAARLLWVGPRRVENVILVLHGGGFAFPATSAHISFWNYVRLQMEKKGLMPGIAVLQYSLWPDVDFPTPLNQLCQAIQLLFAAGLKPSHLQIAGDSAGGHLALQLLSHVLHPHPSVPVLTLAEPIRAVYPLSPWTGLLGETASHDENDKIDCVNKEVLVWLGRRITQGFPDEYLAFAEAMKAPSGWFEGAERVVDSIVITAGEKECLRDDILVFGEIIKKNHGKVEVVVQPGGLHVDMFLDFAAGEKEDRLGMLTPLLLDRLIAACT
ncbi:Alpha/Beta hydrolase protein [Roridomyces roridus]|uniref:Alpha/Beta hydrolase protein n=1 Tax=Roridomyces roridus TaxID=1738132 RepID=A0AAD7FEC9_9AGAR|nr:Alpha/Beta hydrolase protein [Roridomyces roridus]